MNRERVIKVVCIFNSFNFNFAIWKQQLSYNFSSHQNDCWSFKFSMHHLFGNFEGSAMIFQSVLVLSKLSKFSRETVLVDISTSHLYPAILQILLILFKISFITSADDEIQKWISFKIFNKICFYKFDIFYYSLFQSSWNVFSFLC